MASKAKRAKAKKLVDQAYELIRETVLNNPYIPWSPTPLQAVFLAFPGLEALYGGAAGGGKSVALLMGALQYVHVVGYNGMLMRKTLSDLNLPDALIPLSHQWLQQTDAVWNGQDHRWTFPSGATLSFGYLQNENDKYRYQGAQLQYIGIDELTQIPRTRYTYMLSRLRRTNRLRGQVPLRARTASNPGNEGHDYVKRRFITNPEGKRLYVPAKMDDNVHLDKEAYLLSLAELDPVTRAQLQHGDWDIRPEGNMFKRTWFKTVDRAPADIVSTVRHWDLAATEASADNPDPDFIASCKMSITARNTFVIHHVIRDRLGEKEVEELLRNTAKQDGTGVTISIEREPGSAGKLVIGHYARNVLRGFDVRPMGTTVNKQLRAKPLSAAVSRGEVELVSGPWIEAFLDEICPFPDVAHDDQVDAATGAHAKLTNTAEEWTEEDLRAALDDRPPEPDTVKARLLAKLQGQSDV